MKKIFPLILVLLFMLISSVSAEEEIVNLAAVYHADGSITLIGSTTAKYWLVEDMVLVYKEGEDPEEDSPLFFYHISGGDTFSITHPAPYCWHTDRKDEFRDVERMILKPGRYFAIIKRGSLTEDTILSDPAYFTVPSEIVSSSPIPTQTSTLAPTPTPTEEPTPGCNSQAYVRKDRTTGSHRFACAESFFGHWNDPYRCLCYPGRNHLRRACGDLLFSKEEKVNF